MALVQLGNDMTQEQITTYEYCKGYIEFLDSYIKNPIINRQKYGCGSGQPSIEYRLEAIHDELYKEITRLFTNAKINVQKIVQEL